MYLGGYLFLIVLGALLRWAVTYSPAEFSIQTAGLIIMIVGIVGLIISILFWFDGRGYAAPWRRSRYADRGAYGPDESAYRPDERIVHEDIVRDEPPRQRVIREYVPPPRDGADGGASDRLGEPVAYGDTEADTAERSARPPEHSTTPRAR